MARDPAFLFYPGDFNTGTQFFTDDQVGKYMRLLMAQHQHGHLTENQMLHICKSYDKEVFSKFVKDSEGLWYNERLEIEVQKRKNFCLSRKNNKEGKTKNKIISSSYDSHMENENENRNNNAFKYQYREDCFETPEQAFISIRDDEKFVESLTRIARSSGYITTTDVQVVTAVKRYLIREGTKPDFNSRSRADIKNHLINWVSKYAKDLTNG